MTEWERRGEVACPGEFAAVQLPYYYSNYFSALKKKKPNAVISLLPLIRLPRHYEHIFMAYWWLVGLGLCLYFLPFDDHKIPKMQIK